MRNGYPRYDIDNNNNVCFIFDESERSKLLEGDNDGDPNHNVIFIGVKVIDNWDYIKHCTETYFKNNCISYTSYIDMYKDAGFDCRIFTSNKMHWTLEDINKILSTTGYFNKLVNESQL